MWMLVARVAEISDLIPLIEPPIPMKTNSFLSLMSSAHFLRAFSINAQSGGFTQPKRSLSRSKPISR